MNKTSAQKIRRLEMRIAHLEREAGLFDEIKNVPKTLVRKLKSIYREFVSSYKLNTTFNMKRTREDIIEALRVQLELRLRTALDDNIILDNTTFVEVLEYNPAAPELSIVAYGELEMALTDLTKRFAHTGIGTDLKGAYLSWYRDYKNCDKVYKHREGRS